MNLIITSNKNSIKKSDNYIFNYFRNFYFKVYKYVHFVLERTTVP